jgi:hypothetical protein
VLDTKEKLHHILVVDPETAQFIGMAAIKGGKVLGAAALKAGTPVLKVCVGCFGAAVAASEVIHHITGLAPARDVADLARGAVTYDRLKRKYGNYFGGK